MPQSAGYVDIQALQQIAEALRPLKRRTYTLMQIEAGTCVLDVGCGPGLDTIPLAEWVGATGTVVGVDIDEAMLAHATTYAQQANVETRLVHRYGDVSNLPFETATFDACRAERLFQVLPAAVDAEQALGEIRRVTKAGGWVVVADADWGTASLDSPEIALERKLLQFFADQLRPNGYAGRQLFRYFQAQRFVEITVELFPVLFQQVSHTPYSGDWFTGAAVAAGVVTSEEATRWQTSLKQANAAGQFFGSMHMVIVAGRVP
jgi:ubiquinone/menaquinone biosynthesis C-methylase UbiE